MIEDFQLDFHSKYVTKNNVSQISTIGNIEEGSSQLNALLFPIVASIAIILALQIVIIARRR